MNTGKTMFAQLMDHLPWTSFTRIVDRYGGDRYVKLLRCTEQYRAMAFAQLTYREGLRDIEVCLAASLERYFLQLNPEPTAALLTECEPSMVWFTAMAPSARPPSTTLASHSSASQA